MYMLPRYNSFLMKESLRRCHFDKRNRSFPSRGCVSCSCPRDGNSPQFHEWNPGRRFGSSCSRLFALALPDGDPGAVPVSFHQQQDDGIRRHHLASARKGSAFILFGQHGDIEKSSRHEAYGLIHRSVSFSLESGWALEGSSYTQRIMTAPMATRDH